MATSSLQGLRVLVTRPALQADALCQMLAARGAEVRRLPLQSIEPVRPATSVARALAAARDARFWIFTSVNAVRFAALVDQGVWPQTIAVGRATADALERAGHLPLVPSDTYSSEGVLQMPELATVAGAQIAIVTGEDGLKLMHETLSARGAAVQRIAVYRRVALPLAAPALDAALQDCDAALLTSGEALAHLLASVTPAQNERLRALQLVVPSQRVVEELSGLALPRAPLVPDPVADEAYVRCLEQWHAAQSERQQ